MTSTLHENTCAKLEAANELDAKLKTLLQVMVSRIPADKKISASVVLQLLRTKYADTYSEEYIAAQSENISSTLEELLNNRSTTHLSSLPANTAVGVDKSNGKPNINSDATLNKKLQNDSNTSSHSDDSESSSNYSDDDDDDDDEEEEDDDDVDEEDDEEDESFYSSSSSISSSSGSDDNNDTDDESKEEGYTSLEPESKRPKVETEDKCKTLSNTTAEKETNNDDNNNNKDDKNVNEKADNKSVHQRCNQMLTCLKKLSYRVRPRQSDESEQQYIDNVLTVEFVKHGLDPMRCSKSDIHRYKMKREVELLQQDGASLALDRKQRLGRGYSNVELHNTETDKNVNGTAHNTANPSQSTFTTSKFLDDADDE